MAWHNIYYSLCVSGPSVVAKLVERSPWHHDIGNNGSYLLKKKLKTYSIYKFCCFTSIDGDHLSLNDDRGSKRVSFVQAKQLVVLNCDFFVTEFSTITRKWFNNCLFNDNILSMHQRNFEIGRQEHVYCLHVAVNLKFHLIWYLVLKTSKTCWHFVDLK